MGRPFRACESGAVPIDERDSRIGGIDVASQGVAQRMQIDVREDDTDNCP